MHRMIAFIWMVAAIPGVLAASPARENRVEDDRVTGSGSGSWTFATAAERSNYHNLGLALQEYLAPRGFAVEVVATEGSYDNVERLRSPDPERRAHIALLQNDVAYLEHFQGRPYRAVMSLNPELMHVIARRELDVEWATDLSRLDQGSVDVAIGEPGSGSAAHALALLNELGLRECTDGLRERGEGGPCVRIHQLPFTTALLRLTERRIPSEVLRRWGVAGEGRVPEDRVDLVFTTSTAPVEELADLVEAGRGDVFKLLGIDWGIARSMRRHNPFFVVRDLPYATYGVDTKSRRMLGTPTLLVVSNEVPEALVVALLEGVAALIDSTRERELTLLTDLHIEDGLVGVSIPVHPAAASFFRRRESPWKRWVRRLGAYGLLAGVALLPLLLFHLVSGTAYRVQRRRMGRIVGLLIYVWGVGATALYIFEGNRQSSFTPWGQSAVATLHYLLSGLEAKYPSTLGGIAVSIAILTVGVTVVALFTGEIARMLMERTLNVKRLRTKPFEFASRWRAAGRVLSAFTLRDHVVLVGWSSRTERVLRQLQSDDLRINPQVVVVTPRESDAETSDRSVAKSAWVVAGEAHDPAVLERADLATARAALITTSGDRETSLPAVATVRTMDQLRREYGSGVRLIVEARNREMLEHLDTCSVADEIVETEFLGERLLAHCVVTPGVVRVYEELLNFQRGSMEIYSAPVPRPFQGLGFRELRCLLASTRVIPVGVEIGGVPVLNPSQELEGGVFDRLLFVADDDGALERTSRQLKRRRGKRGPGSPRAAESVKLPSGGGIMNQVEVKGSLRLAVCGWNESARGLIEQLLSSELTQGREIDITVIEDICSTDIVAVEDGSGLRRFEPRDREHLPENVHFVIGDPTRRGVLQRAAVGEMDALVVLGSRENGAMEKTSDHRALVICLTATSLNSDLHVIVELTRPESREHFRGFQKVDLVCLEDLAEKLLAQATVSPGITRVYSELLNAVDESNEIYVVPVSEVWRGQTFQGLVNHLAEAAEPVIPLGYRTSADALEVFVLNPPQERKQSGGVERWREHRLSEGEAVVVMADHEPRL